MTQANPTIVRDGRRISRSVARAIYQRGLGLRLEQWAEFDVSTERGEPITLVVGNGGGGVVEVICPNALIREELGALVGFRIVGPADEGDAP